MTRNQYHTKFVFTHPTKFPLTAYGAENDNNLQGGCSVMRLDGSGLLFDDMANMIRFYRDVL